MSKSVPVHQGRARIHPPKEPGGSWRIVYHEPITQKRKMTWGGKTQDEAENRAAELLGDWTPTSTHGEQPPTLQDVFFSWMEDNRSNWGERTFDQYAVMGRRFLKKLGDEAITRISPQDFAQVDLTDLGRQQQNRVRSLIRGTMGHASRWVKNDPSVYADAVKLSGSRSDAREYRVARGDIAPGTYIYDVITACYATSQIHPIYEYWSQTGDQLLPDFDPVTGKVSVHWDTSDWRALDGMSSEWVQKQHRRRMPKHYKNIDKRMRDETAEMAERYRMFALAVGISAGIGLRIGEVLPLRVRDFIPNHPGKMKDLFVNERAADPGNQLASWGYRGQLEINKQSTASGSGKIVLSLPKFGKRRTVWIPALLYHRNETPHYIAMKRRDQALSIGLGGMFEDKNYSLWNITRFEALQLWSEGMIPLGWLLMRRLNDLWDKLHANTEDQDWRYDDFQKLLLFPTRSQPRRNSQILIPTRWHEDPELVPGFGGYVSTTNFANVMTNPIFDYVSAKTDSYPDHRRSLPSHKRKGWTFHALRHYFVTSSIYHGTALPSISKLAGHATVDFTMNRYSHALEDTYKAVGFE